MKKSFLIVAVFAAGILLLPVSAKAEAFSIERFSSSIDVRPDGQIIVEEKIEVNFREPRHGIFRNIPVRYTDSHGVTRSIRLKVKRVVDERNQAVPYRVSRKGRSVEITIGDPDRTVEGPATYRITYTADRAILFFDDHDELYWNVTGTEWPVPIPRATAYLTVPAPIDEITAECYTGPYGSAERNCAVGQYEREIVVVAKDFLTVAAGWPKGYVRAPTAWDEIRWFIADNAIAFMPLAILAALFYVWWTRGRDVRGRKTIIAEYGPPEGMTPAEMGTLVDARVHPRDFSAAIVHLAVKGYLRIIEEEDGGLFRRKSYSLERLKEPGRELESHERVIIENLFAHGARVRLAPRSANAAFNLFAQDLYKHLARQNYFVRNPQYVRAGFFFIGFALIVLAIAAVRLGTLVFVSFAACGALFLLFAPIMPKKTRKGTLAYEHALGFREFLSVAEKYRIRWQEKEGIFERYLPYAMVFGAAEKWTRALAGTVREPPSWYSGSFPSGWNAAVFASSLDSFSRSANSAAAPAKGAGAGSSGLGGGGFSGGGFGGGGGGSW